MDTNPIAAPPVAPGAPPAAVEKKAEKPKAPPTWKKFVPLIEESRTVRKSLVENEWKRNVEYRRGKPYPGELDVDRVSVPVDWSFTKAKEAGLFSQVPTVLLEAAHDRYKAAVGPMQKELNDVLSKQVKIEVAMEESLADVINAAGIAGTLCGYLATFEDTEVPSQDVSAFPPEVQQALFDNGIVKMLPTKKRIDCRFYADRLSPSQLLWPKAFKGSDFDNADWVGADLSGTWAQVLREFGKTAERPNGLTPEMKDKVCGGAIEPNTLSEPTEGDKPDTNENVSYTRIFFWAARQDPEETKLEKIRQLVFVNGIEAPVVDEDLKWQEWSPSTESFIGITKFPLRICTLTYISDQPVPPSDSEIGRPQVDEKMRSRSQMVLQRDRAQPMRGVNVNRVDPMVLANLMRGETQQIIPVNGDPSQAFAEVTRASYPRENWDFDRVTDKDLMDAWQVGPNQSGNFNSGGRTAAEANIVQGNFASRQAKERGKITKYFLGIAECIAGLMQLYYDGPKEDALIGPDGVKQMTGAWDRKAVSGAKFVFKIREDATVKLDSQQRIDQVTKFLNIAGKSGFVDVKPIMEELAALSGLDPARVVIQPNPKAPEPPNVSLRAGGEDLRDPIVGAYLVALMQKGHPVSKDDVEAAKQVLISASSPAAPLPPPPPGPGGPPQPPENYGPMERVTKRTDEMGG